MTEPPILKRSEPPVVQQAGRIPTATAQAGKQTPVDDGGRGHPKGPLSVKSLLAGYMHKRWAVLLLLFGATAALGLPILWKSRGFSLAEKIVWTVLVSLYTVLVFWIFFRVMWWSYTNISESLS